ncbi:hypothetical protein PQG02_12860 [Nostoc sp. UHCC 0926]|nr:hypothetical protein PQG02_12860 [Nostoc sp. UHCC 0926]
MKSNQIPPGSFGIPILGETLFLRSYHWEILANQNLEVVRVPTNRPKNGLRVRFQPQ